jgi:alpha-glucoside transport system permease protein
MSSANVTAAPGVGEPPAPAPGKARRRNWLVAAGFLLPALFFLGVWLVHPAIRTIIRSFFDRSGDTWVWFRNYETLFTTDILVTAIRNNALWIAVVPALVTVFGLMYAVLTERIRWSVAFKTAVFMPMAISLFASGVIWRVMLQKDPDVGAVNAVIAAVDDAFSPGVLPDAQPSTDDLVEAGGGIDLSNPLQPGDVARLGLTGIAPDEVPAGAEQAVVPEAIDGGITGVVWRDFRPGGGTPGEVEEEEVGIPGAVVELRTPDGDVESTTTGSDGTFAFDELEPGEYRIAVGADTFAEPFEGISWLGPDLILPSMFIAYIWIWAGFAMVILAAGLAAIPRDLLEAARIDGANEWQVFRRVTAPLLTPVLVVVFITMIINVLKAFDIVLSIAPGSVQDEANVIALAMWRTSFGGVRNFGLGSAIAVFLFVLVIPVLALNIRRFRRET